MRRRGFVLLVPIAFTSALVTACSTDSTDSTEAPVTTTSLGSTTREADPDVPLPVIAENIVSSFLRFADEPSPDTVERLPFAEEVRLGLGSELHLTRSRSQLADPAAWVIDEELFRAYAGPFSAVDVASKARSTVVSVGEHPHCASPPVPPPEEVADLTRVSVQPDIEQIDSCLRWWTVDFFVNKAGQIQAVTLDLWEP